MIDDDTDSRWPPPPHSVKSEQSDSRFQLFPCYMFSVSDLKSLEPKLFLTIHSCTCLMRNNSVQRSFVDFCTSSIFLLDLTNHKRALALTSPRTRPSVPRCTVQIYQTCFTIRSPSVPLLISCRHRLQGRVTNTLLEVVATHPSLLSPRKSKQIAGWFYPCERVITLNFGSVPCGPRACVGKQHHGQAV